MAHEIEKCYNEYCRSLRKEIMDVNITKDKKGRCWFVSHRRCGVTEGIFLDISELYDLRKLLDSIL